MAEKIIKKTIITQYQNQDENGDFKFGNVESVFGATNRYFTQSGKPWMPLVGEFHFSRYDNSLWDRELAKMKAEGLNGVAVYVFWNHHEVKSGKFDFEGDKDIKKFLGSCRKQDLKVVLRIGPWCHGEARLGGYPDYLRFVAGKRKTTPLYMYYVKRYWTRLYQEVAPFCDGKTVIGIQMENEYGGSISHIFDLRKLAESIGFKTPFFTMTKWPTDTPSKYFLPMEGGYPEAPWTQHKRPLAPNNRFAISSQSNDSEIGADLIKKKRKTMDFSNFPFAGCEVGVGNQVTAHRRPVISDLDGYGVAFAKLASGMNWMGYYMYHGGRNPSMAKPMQESRITLYPNNYPIVDYDFQAPISKDGKVRKHGDRLRLLHTFINEWDKDFAKSQAFFAIENTMPYISVRALKNSGFVFISNYERGYVSQQSKLDIEISFDGRAMKISKVAVDKDSMFFFPVNCKIGELKLDYVIAQPIYKAVKEDGLHAYFMRAGNGEVRLSQNGVEQVCKEETLRFDEFDTPVFLHFIEEKDALNLHYIDNRALFSRSSIYRRGGRAVAEIYDGDSVTEDNKSIIALPLKDLTDFVKLSEIKSAALKYNYYMYSMGKRKHYQLNIDTDIFNSVDDIEIQLSFSGLNLQIFHGKDLVDDYFNTDGICVFRLGRLKDRLLKDNRLTIRACAKTAWGVGNPYNEINMQNKVIGMKIKQIRGIHIREI